MCVGCGWDAVGGRVCVTRSTKPSFLGYQSIFYLVLFVAQGWVQHLDPKACPVLLLPQSSPPLTSGFDKTTCNSSISHEYVFQDLDLDVIPFCDVLISFEGHSNMFCLSWVCCILHTCARSKRLACLLFFHW